MTEKSNSSETGKKAKELEQLLARLRRREDAKAAVTRAREIERLQHGENAETHRIMRAAAEELLVEISSEIAAELCPQSGPDEITNRTNPYFEIFRILPPIAPDLLYVREVLVNKYSWAIPNEQALATIAKYAPIIEVGAGTGYWAALLKARGTDVLAVDATPVESGLNDSYTQATSSFTEIIVSDETIVAKHPNRTLFICWPPNESSMPCNALGHYTGKHFIYVAENDGNTDVPIHVLLEEQWHLIDAVDIPQWHGMHDWLQVYERKG